MSKSKKTAKARELQAVTGMPYTAALRQVEAEHAEGQPKWGPELLTELLHDSDVDSVHVLPSATVMVRFKDGSWKALAKGKETTVATATHVDRAVRAFAAEHDIDVPARNGEVNAHLTDGTGTVRLFVAVNEYGHAEAVLRKYYEHDLDELVELDVLTEDQADLLVNAVRSGQTVAVTGRTGTGKTTLVNALAPYLPGRGVVVEEVRSHDELAQVLDAAQEGGALFTIFADSPERALDLLSLYGSEPGGVREHTPASISNGIDLVVHMTKASRGGRFVRHVDVIAEPFVSESVRVRPVSAQVQHA